MIRPVKRRKKRRVNTEVCSNAEFVERWQKAKTVGEAAMLTGHTVAGARFKAWRLREDGVPLKRFKRGATRSERDIPELKRLALRYQP